MSSFISTAEKIAMDNLRTVNGRLNRQLTDANTRAAKALEEKEATEEQMRIVKNDLTNALSTISDLKAEVSRLTADLAKTNAKITRKTKTEESETKSE